MEKKAVIVIMDLEGNMSHKKVDPNNAITEAHSLADKNSIIEEDEHRNMIWYGQDKNIIMFENEDNVDLSDSVEL